MKQILWSMVLVASLAVAGERRQMADIKTAVLSADKTQVLVGRKGADLEVLDANTLGTTGGVKESAGVTAILADQEEVLAARANELLFVNPKVGTVTAMVKISVDQPANISVVAGNLVLVADRAFKDAVVVDRNTRSVVTDMDRIIPGLLYATAGTANKNGELIIPSAYPGRLVFVNEADAKQGKVTRSLNVHDWIHDVKVIDEKQFMTAGHLDGICFQNPGKEEGTLEQNCVDREMRFGHILVEDDVVIATDIERILRVDPVSGESSKAKLNTFAGSEVGRESVIPLGRNKSGLIVIYQERKGLFLVE